MTGRWGGRQSPHVVAKDEWSDEAREAAARARASGSHASPQQTKTVSSQQASEKVRMAPTEKLHAALKHPNTDPQVKKLIERELANRNMPRPAANTMAGHKLEKEYRMLGMKSVPQQRTSTGIPIRYKD